MVMDTPPVVDGAERILVARGRRAAADAVRAELTRHVADDKRTHSGRLAEGLARAAAIIDPIPTLPENPWAETFAEIVSACDVASVGLYLGVPWDQEGHHTEEPYPDMLPIRVAVDDGAESVRAVAYLTEDEAEELALAILKAVDKARAERKLVASWTEEHPES